MSDLHMLGLDMDVLEAIKGRTSTRAFLKMEVSENTVRKILDTARWSPSGVNSQPWQVAVTAGETKRIIGDRIIAAFENGQRGNPDYKYYADRFPEPYRSRQVACGVALYGALGIQREDKERRREQWIKNYHGFDAPIELFLFIDEALEKGSWLDTGMFIQSIMLAARAFGLETCPQAALSEYPDIVRDVLDIPNSLHLVCGIAVGYPESGDPVNNYRTDREEVDTFTRWYGIA